jgi:hypothetical protein
VDSELGILLYEVNALEPKFGNLGSRYEGVFGKI